MVFKHNKMPFDNDDSFQLSFQYIRQLDCGNEFASSGHRHIPEKQHFPDGVRPGGNNVMLENVNAVASNDNSGYTLDNTSNLSWVSDSETVRLEHSKRPFGDDKNLQVAAKRTRQMDVNISPFRSTCVGSFIASTADEELKSRRDAAVPGSAYDSRGSSFIFPRFLYSASEEDSRLERPGRLSFFPGYYEDHRWPAGYNRVKVCLSPVFNYLPRKRVAIGPDHQADIPVWRPKRFQDCCGADGPGVSTSSVHVLTDEDSCDKWIGHCVMPMPDSISLDLDGPLGCCKTSCRCLDEGSIRCVRQHVREVREERRSTLGHERFVELGFCDMGEVVALGWTEEEEQLFLEVVASYPASLGMNFWDVLPRAFPSRSSKELVSYYFNVFMLRKRAEQNRFDPLNVDSDNDEWQESDDGEFGATEVDEEDDSGVESPADDAAHGNEVHGDEVDIYEEVEEDYSDHEECGVSSGFLGDNDSKLSPSVQPMGLNFHDCTGEDQDVHDDSCTSYEGQRNGADAFCGGADGSEGMRDSLGEEGVHGDLHAEYRNSGISGLPDQDFMVGLCDPKPWDMGHFRGFDKDLDFWPTCNVIEEVFGNGSWEKSREGHGVS